MVPFTIAGQLALLSASLGITLYPDDNTDPDTLLRHVDQAMYEAKQAGGHDYRWFDTSLAAPATIVRCCNRFETG